jgi:hypothetical protein
MTNSTPHPCGVLPRKAQRHENLPSCQIATVECQGHRSTGKVLQCWPALEWIQAARITSSTLPLDQTLACHPAHCAGGANYQGSSRLLRLAPKSCCLRRRYLECCISKTRQRCKHDLAFRAAGPRAALLPHMHPTLVCRRRSSKSHAAHAYMPTGALVQHAPERHC